MTKKAQKVGLEYFQRYKDIHENASAIMFGNGPTLKQFVDKKENTSIIRAGLNEIIFTDIDIDYFFLGDAGDKNLTKDMQAYHDYFPKKQKFVGLDPRDFLNFQLYLDGGLVDKAIHYDCHVDRSRGGYDAMAKDLSSSPMPRLGSISFEVLQFLLYTGVKKIFLVGHDCDYRFGTFTGENVNLTDVAHGGSIKLLNSWNHAKNFIDKEYPEVEIYSVNPVALTIFPAVDQAEVWK